MLSYCLVSCLSSSVAAERRRSLLNVTNNNPNLVSHFCRELCNIWLNQTVNQRYVFSCPTDRSAPFVCPLTALLSRCTPSSHKRWTSQRKPPWHLVFFNFLRISLVSCLTEVMVSTMYYVGIVCIGYAILFSSVVRLLLPDERVHEIYIENYTNGEVTCIVMKRWMFNTKLESRLCRDETALSYMFWEVKHLMVVA